MPNEEAPPLNLSLRFLREGEGVTQGTLAERLGCSETALIDLEKGRTTASPERVSQILGILGLKPKAVGWMSDAVRKVRAHGRRRGRADDPAGEAREEIQGMIAGAVEAFEIFLQSGIDRLFRELDVLEARRQAPLLWNRLRRLPHARRLLLVREKEEFHNWALCVRVADESLKAAADVAAKAVELAELGLEIARRVRGGQEWRWRTEGWARFHLGNALRVANGPKAADELAQAKKLWADGAPGDPGLLNESRVLGLEASLLRAQRRLPEALELLNDALKIDQWGETRNLLLNRATVLHVMGDFEASIEALRAAAPLLDERREPWLLFALRFDWIVNLTLLSRPAEAAPLLTDLRALAERLQNELGSIKLRWLEGRLAAGFGREDEALAALEDARRAFSARALPYNLALVNLDLALLHLERGRTAQVRELAVQMLRIFPAQGVYRETLAALRLFHEAAMSGAVTAELVRELIRYVHRAQHDSKLHFEPAVVGARKGGPAPPKAPARKAV